MWWIIGAAGLAGVLGWGFFFAGRRDFAWQRAPAAPDMRRDGATRETVRFGEIEGWLYLPVAARPPVIVMAPGLTGTKEGLLERFAWAFVAAGYAVLAIDFRTFGGSDGTPRHWLDPQRQVEDYGAALAFLRGEARVDADRIVLWGTSFSGAAAIGAAARSGIAAVIAQVPYLGGAPVHAPSFAQMAGYVALSVAEDVGDALARLVGLRLKPVTITTYGRPGERAFAMSRDNPSRRGGGETLHPFWQAAAGPLRGGWRNAMLVRGLRNLDAVRAGEMLRGLRCPVFLIAAMQDDMIAFETLRVAAGRLPAGGSRFLQLDCGHYDPYVGTVFETNVRAQVAFLGDVLGG